MAARRIVTAAVVVAALVGSAAPAAAGGVPNISVTPSTDLVHGQEVAVHGENWRSGSFLVFFQCDARADSVNGCDESNAEFLEPGHPESFSIPFEVERTIQSRRFGIVDCATAPGACVIGVFARPGRMLDSAALGFDPEGPTAPRPLQLDVDVASAVRLRPDGRGARVDVVLRCHPGMHAEVFVQVVQDGGEDDVVASGGRFLDRCRGTRTLTIEVRAQQGGTLTAGHGAVFGQAFGFRFAGERFVEDSEFVEATLGR